MKVIEWMVKYKLAKSKSEARRLIKQGAVKICDANYGELFVITSPNFDMGELKGETI